MAVYFVYRSHYGNPGAFHVRRFDAETVLDWFRSIWKGIPNEQPTWEASSYAEKLIGRSVYSFGSLFGSIHEHNWPPPKSMNELGRRLNNAVYVGELQGLGHHIQILTDDDELEMAIYIFDDHYVKKHPDRCAFLMREDWVLPDGMASGAFKPPRGVPKLNAGQQGEGCTYLAHFAAYDSGSLTDLGPDEGFCLTGCVPGVRVPDFPRFLVPLTTRDHEDVGSEIAQLLSGVTPAVKAAKGQEKAFLKAVTANPNDQVCWGAYTDWLLENDRPPLLERILKKYIPEAGCSTDSRRPKKDRIVVQSHVAQASKHVTRWGKDDLYHHFALFDDLWANAYPHLAASLLRTATRWDPL
jgi:uncharacterized protein (TIGR02996 family)